MRYTLFILFSLVLSCVLALPGSAYAQSPAVNTDSLMQEAQQYAAAKKYTKARQLARQVLNIAPEYADASLLIGRTYAWESDYDSARAALIPLLNSPALQEQAFSVLASVELWAANPGASLEYAEQGLENAPNSTSLSITKALALRDLRRYKEAIAFTQAALEKFPSNPDLLKLKEQLDELNRGNLLSIDYQFTTFDQDIPNWQLATVQYTRTTPIGAFSGKINYADRFGTSGLQAEVDAWPRLNTKTYAYINFGVSNSKLFPDYRAGAELYRILPHQMEASVGARALAYTNETVWLYTGHIGKYFHKYWASFRPFFQYQQDNWQATGILMFRRYFRYDDEYVTLSLSKGSTPFVQVALQEINRLDANKVSLDGQYRLSSQFLLGATLQYELEKYAENSSRKRFTSGLKLQYKF
ncbi:YaiO family outer membrane beta-barrel protein [Pontibacter sp. MBLB2868]|uniref:YaiO family outer membrane beta-barrel protein n=1 Tax=Pontibacter sp. MBLB2868 TaxID=3451555 RepID=UPI003F74DB63